MTRKAAPKPGKYDETRELITLASSQLRKAKTALSRVNVNTVSVKALLQNAQRVNRSAQRTFRKESK